MSIDEEIAILMNFRLQEERLSKAMEECIAVFGELTATAYCSIMPS